MEASSHREPLLLCQESGWGSRRQVEKMPPQPTPCPSLPVTGREGDGKTSTLHHPRCRCTQACPASVCSGVSTHQVQDDISKSSQALGGRLYSAGRLQQAQPAELWGIQLFTAQLFNEHLSCVIWGGGGEDMDDKQKNPQAFLVGGGRDKIKTPGLFTSHKC